MTRTIIAFAILPLLASCVAPQTTATPAPAPRPTTGDAPWRPASAAPSAVRADYVGDWSTDDLTAGEWMLRDEAGRLSVLFTAAGGADAFALTCADGRITLSRSGDGAALNGAPIKISTSFAARTLPISANGANRMQTAPLPATDPLFDQIAFSRGRILVETPAHRPLLIPVRSEVVRVVEQCRG
ncbi:MAG: hypothetical protein ACKOUM_11935 [Sphingopyxis sp.]